MAGYLFCHGSKGNLLKRGDALSISRLALKVVCLQFRCHGLMGRFEVAPASRTQLHGRDTWKAPLY